MNIEEIKFPNQGVLCATLPDNVFEELKISVQKQIDNKLINYKLKRLSVKDFTVNGIEEVISYTVPNSYLEFLYNLSKEYVNYFRIGYLQAQSPKLGPVWINLQKRYEYRPCHRHGKGRGDALSFTTYITIPYNEEEEDKYPNHDSRSIRHRNGRLEFTYNFLSGKMETYTVNINKNFEGKTLIFANDLWHTVYPFYTSENYRVSVAGNVDFI